jgi:hypothetical protein
MVVVSNLLEDLGERRLVHFNKLLGQVSFEDPLVRARQSPRACSDPC